MKKLFGATDIGLVRTSNQDIFMVETLSPELSFAVLCDGMGGEQGGGEASRLAAEYVFGAVRRDLGGLAPGAEPTELGFRAALTSAVAGANAVVFDAAEKDASLKGMGTTMILVVFYKSRLYLASVGDSRAYLASESEVRQITRDHTVVQMLIDMGEITLEEAKTHPKRHFITRAVGVAANVEADFIVEELAAGDAVLLCSDGLYGYLQPEGIFNLLKRCLESGNAMPLIELAKAGGGADNITAVVFGDCVEEQ